MPDNSNLENYLKQHLDTGRITEISELLCSFFNVSSVDKIRSEDKLYALCLAEDITADELDKMISDNPPAIRTIKGHSFEVIFSKILELNDVPHDEIGGDSDYDFSILGNTLQLKTPNENSCTDQAMAYKTHKTHGAKSQDEALSYYHKASDFADYLVGLITYDPFTVFIVPRDRIPRIPDHQEYLASPAFFPMSTVELINNFKQLGINDEIIYPDIVNLGNNELLPYTAEKIGVRSNYILNAIFRKENFRIWDMNLRGFVRETRIKEAVREQGINEYDPKGITTRPEKVDLVLRKKNGEMVRFQIKGLTIGNCKLQGPDSYIACETQLSRGRVNDHPTQSRLYLATDFDELLIAMDPAYTNAFSKETFGHSDFQWSFYSIPTNQLRRHKQFERRLASNQTIRFSDLQQYRINEEWFLIWEKHKEETV